ncbi:MAG: hypothetical protein L0Z49_11990 [Actinobacteria bacterium]|nr:hypothetical protein [Actinomycetota bacterium]
MSNELFPVGTIVHSIAGGPDHLYKVVRHEEQYGILFAIGQRMLKSGKRLNLNGTQLVVSHRYFKAI